MILEQSLSLSRLKRAACRVHHLKSKINFLHCRDVQCFTKLNRCWLFGDEWRAVLAQHDFSLWNSVEHEKMMKETWLESLIIAIKQRVFNWVEDYNLFKETIHLSYSIEEKFNLFILWLSTWKNFFKELQLLSQHVKFNTLLIILHVAHWTLRSDVAQHETLRVWERNVCATLAIHPRKWFRFRRHDSGVGDEYNSVRC